MLKKAVHMILLTDKWNLNFLGRERTSVFIACLQPFPWFESGDTIPHHLSQYVAKTHCLLSGSTADVRVILPYATACDRL
jgi:hypothetical protein